eukprot:4280741-Amphidinium_carterae.1
MWWDCLRHSLSFRATTGNALCAHCATHAGGLWQDRLVAQILASSRLQPADLEMNATRTLTNVTESGQNTSLPSHRSWLLQHFLRGILVH